MMILCDDDHLDAANVLKKSNHVMVGNASVKICPWYNYVSSMSEKKKFRKNPQKSSSKLKSKF